MCEVLVGGQNFSPTESITERVREEVSCTENPHQKSDSVLLIQNIKYKSFFFNYHLSIY